MRRIVLVLTLILIVSALFNGSIHLKSSGFEVKYPLTAHKWRTTPGEIASLVNPLSYPQKGNLTITYRPTGVISGKYSFLIKSSSKYVPIYLAILRRPGVLKLNLTIDGKPVNLSRLDRYELNVSPQATVWVYVINVSTHSREIFGKVTYELNYSKVKSLNSNWIIGTPVTWWAISGKEQSMNLSVNLPGGYAFLSNYGLLTSSTRITVNPDELQGVAFIRIGGTLHLSIKRIDVTVYISKSCEYTNDSLGSLIGDIKDAISEYINMTGIVPVRKVDVLITTEKYDNGELINSNPPVAVLGCSRWNVASLENLVFQNPGLIFHELAHLWFGYYSDIGRVDESLATYMALTAECRTSNCTGMLDEIENFKVLPSLGQNVSLSTAYQEGVLNPGLRDAIIYYRGAFVFRSLQFVLGNTTFREALHRLLVECHQRNCNLTYVRNVFGNVSGRNLGWFFKEWFYTSKVPDYSVVNVSLKETKSGHYSLTFAILDKNNFTMPLQVEVVTQNEKLIRTVWVKGSANVGFKTVTKPIKIILDPNEWVANENRLYSVNGIVVEIN